jgi:predicted outer membrane protein
MKTNLTKTLGFTLASCALAGLAFAEDQVPQHRYLEGVDNQPITSQNFVWDAATTDMKEIQMGEMALQKSDNADVKNFAKRLIADHKKACQKLQSIAEKEGLNCPGTNSMNWGMQGDMKDRWQANSMHANSDYWPTNQNHAMTSEPDKDSPPHLATMLKSSPTKMMGMEMEMNWESMSGADFDRAFASHMVMGHEKAIGKFEMAAASLQDAGLKTYAEKNLPTLRNHLRMAQELQSKVGMWSEPGMTNSMPQNGYRN